MDALDKYLAKRDVGERRTLGEIPRAANAVWDDLVLSVAAVLASTWTIATSTTIGSPPFATSSVVAAGIVLVSLAVRRRHAHRPRVRRVTFATIVTSGALGVAIAGLLITDTLLRHT